MQNHPSEHRYVEPLREARTEILSNNKIGNHNVILVALAPIIATWGGFVLLLLLASLTIFALTNWHGFLAFMPSVFTWSMYAAGAVIVLTLAAFAIKYVLGGLITHVIGGLVREVIVPLRQSKVPAASDQWAVTKRKDGELEFNQVSQDRTNLTLRGEIAAPEQKALPAPERTVPTARQLIEDGTVARAQSRGEIILGLLDDGSLKTMNYDELYSTDLGGVGGSGKTTTAFWINVQELFAGTKLIVVDPHIHVKRRGEAQGLGQLLKPFTFAHHFPPCDDDPSAIMERARYMRDENERRKRPGVKLDTLPQIMMVFDEFNTVIEIAEIKKELGDIIAKVQREGRKLGLFFLLVGHRWSEADIGNIKIRTNAATVMAHYYNDAGQAGKLIGEADGKRCLSLVQGAYWLKGLHTGDLVKVHTPKITEADIPFILDMLGQPIPYPTGTTVEADPPPEVSPTHRHTDEIGGTLGDTYRQPVEPMEVTTSVTLTQAQMAKMAMVLEMDAKQASQNEIIAAVWNVNPKDRAGQDAARELRLIRAYMAEQATRQRKA